MILVMVVILVTMMVVLVIVKSIMKMSFVADAKLIIAFPFLWKRNLLMRQEV